MSNWKLTLKRMKLDHLRATATGFFEASGGYDLQVKAYADNTANALTRSIIDYLTFKHHSATRISSTGMMRRINGEMKYTKGATRKGVADIHAIINGRHVSIEIKIGADGMSEHQIAEEKRVTNAGGLYYIARSMPEFIIWYNEIFTSNVN